jgi:putative transposase
MIIAEKPGWHSRGYLPHYDANTLLQHVVFRTYGSLPQHVMNQISSAPPDLRRSLADMALDDSKLGRVFSDPNYAAIMQAALRHFDGDRYDLQAWCIMPNHVHVVLVTNPRVLMGRIIKSWKHSVARHINQLRKTSGPVFAPDYFDRFIRTLKQAEAALHYVEANPVKAGLVWEAAQHSWSSASARANGWTPRQDRLPIFID